MRNIQQQTDKTRDVTPRLVKIFYSYFALLPLLSILALFFDKDIWHKYSVIFSEFHIIATYLYHFFSLIIFVGSGFATVAIIRFIPIPKNNILLWFILLDTPITLLINYFTGASQSLADMIIFDFAFELFVLTLAIIILGIKEKKSFFLAFYSAAVFLSYIGVHVYSLILEFNLKTIIIISSNLILSVVFYYKNLKEHSEGIKPTKIQKSFEPLAGVMGVFAVNFLIIIYLYKFFKFFWS